MSANPSPSQWGRRELLCVISVAASYLLLWNFVLAWTGKWPAPYWYAIGLGVLLAHGLLMPSFKGFWMILLFACFTSSVSWFVDLGIYQDWARTWLFEGRRVRRLGYWSETLPVLVLMSSFVIVTFNKVAARGWRFELSLWLFLTSFASLFVFRDTACSFYLPQDGTFLSGDHDIFGFRLGGYYLVTVFLSVSFLKLCPAKSLADGTEQPPQQPLPIEPTGRRSS